MLSLTALFLSAALAADPEVLADLVITNATIYDGTGQPPIKGDIAIANNEIVGVGIFKCTGKTHRIDGKGLIVAPGFIDLHTHSDTSLPTRETRNNLNYLRQGVTTVVTGNCGTGPTDVAGYFKTLEKGDIGTNVIHLVPHNNVRSAVLGNANRQPTAAELKKMEALVDQGMKDGAWGLSTGLIYNPGTYARADELIALAKIAARHDGFYASHIRDESTGLLTALDEALKIGKEAGLPVHISHLKASGKKAWGKAADALALIEDARKKGQVVTADQYPYTASSTSLIATIVPAQFRDGSPKDLIARLDDPGETGRNLRNAIKELLEGFDNGKAIRIASYARRTDWNGKDIAALADQAKKRPVDIGIEILKNGGAHIVIFSMNEEDVRLIMKQPFVATASDGSAAIPGPSVPHPRNYGCFPRKIGRYALVDQVIPMEQAIRSATGLPADILKLPKRGYLKVGYAADIVAFDPETFRDTATFDKPHQYATGVRYLLINGMLVIDTGKYTGALAGAVLRHSKAE